MCSPGTSPAHPNVVERTLTELQHVFVFTTVVLCVCADHGVMVVDCITSSEVLYKWSLASGQLFSVRDLARSTWSWPVYGEMMLC